MPGERHTACIELLHSNGPPGLKRRSRITDVGWPTVTAHRTFSVTEVNDLADEHVWAIKCL
jgi:hypothetical protein